MMQSMTGQREGSTDLRDLHDLLHKVIASQAHVARRGRGRGRGRGSDVAKPRLIQHVPSHPVDGYEESNCSPRLLQECGVMDSSQGPYKWDTGMADVLYCRWGLGVT